MNMRAMGIILMWLGTVLLVAVLQHRIRKGAWLAESLEDPPPLERWTVAVAAIGMASSMAGAGLLLWSFW